MGGLGWGMLLIDTYLTLGKLCCKTAQKTKERRETWLYMADLSSYYVLSINLDPQNNSI